ncbi:MAG: response regulator [bacterium]|nr:response regulator [bacterium]
MIQPNDLSLLLVDDEAAIRSGLRSKIPYEQFGISLIGTACNGTEALEMIRWYEPDIVITDIQMPTVSGLDLICRAREEGHDCYFVILSGYDDFQYAQQAIRYGVRDYLLKPISLSELSDILGRLRSEILSKRQSRTEELSTLKDLRKAHISIRKNQLIPELLRGEISETELSSILSDYALPLKNELCVIGLLQLFHPLNEAEDSEDNPHKLALLRESLEQHLEQKLQHLPQIVTQTPDSLLLLSNLPNADSSLLALKTFLEDFILQMQQSLHLTLFASIGRPAENLLTLAPSYQSALQALSFHIYPNLGPVIEASILDLPAPPAALPSDAKILDSILQGDESSLCRELDDYFSSLHYISTPPPSYLYSMCNYLILTLKNSLTQYLGKPPASYSGDSYLALQNFGSIADIRAWMYETLNAFLHELQINRLTRNDPLIEKAISYIQDNILGKIHMDDICNHVGLSKSYFSTYFKNKTQLNFRDYILDLKISYAQEQLKRLEHSAKELAILLGYEDYRSFSRAFKLRTGFTPSDYQKKYNPTEVS